MKKQIVLGALTLWSSVSFAQTNRSVNYVTPENLQTKVNTFFASINTTQITSGVLMDKSIEAVSPVVFNGTVSSPYATVNDWYALYQQVSGARINSSWSLPTQQSLFEKIDYHKSEDRVPLGILFADYQQIKDGAVATEAWFTISNNKLSDVPGRNQNPYEQKLLAVGTTFRSDYEDGNVTFIVPSDLILTNKGTFTLQIDFGNGSGWVPIAPNTPISIHYSSAGIKDISFKFTQGGVSYYTQTHFTIKNVFSFTNTFGKNCMGVCFDALWADVNQQTGNFNTTSEAYIIYANGRNHLQKPFIFVEGQDLDEVYNFPDLFYALSNYDPSSTNAPLNQLISNGYDVIILNFKRRSAESMRSNGEVLRRLINWVNQQKQGTDKITLSGVSMGGVISRYILAKMENVYCENHNVEKYLSLDAPHTGANVPLGLQILTRNINALSFNFSYDLARSYNQVVATSTMELLSAHVWGNGGRTILGTSFYNELKQLGMPQKCRNVAWGNGNTFNNIPAPTDGSLAFNQGDEILGYTKNSNPSSGQQLNMRIAVNAVNSATVSPVLNLKLKWGFKKHFPFPLSMFNIDNTFIDMDDWFNFQTDKPYDNSPGGYIFTQQNVAQGLSGSTTNGRNHHCIVPTMSAFGIETNALFYNQTYQNIDISRVSPFDAVYASSNSINYGHKILPPNLGTQLLGEMITPPVLRNSLQNLQNQTYNMSVFSTIQKLPSISVNNSGVLQINGGMGSDFGLGQIPAQGSSVTINTNDCPAIIHVQAGGLFKIGDGVRFATVNIGSGSSVIIHNGGKLDVRWGSKLVLSGGSLVFEEGAIVNLQDLESVLEIQDGGKILIGSKAKFSWSGSGFLRINTTTKGVPNILATAAGNNAKFEQRTTVNTTRKVIEVLQGSLSVNKNISDFKIISGSIKMGEATIFDVEAPMYLVDVKMDVINPGTRFSGIWVYGQQSTAYLSTCTINNADIGLRIFANKGIANKAVVFNSNFNNCDVGILSYGKSVEVDRGTFWGNKTGIYVSGAQFASNISNIVSRGNRSAIDIVGSGTDVLNLKRVNMYNNSAVGAFMVNSTVVPACSKIYNNYPVSNPTEGSNILLRENSQLDIESVGAKKVGNNLLSNVNSPAVNCVRAKGLLLDKGLTDFGKSLSPYTIKGTLDAWPGRAPRPVVLATQNYWGAPFRSPFSGIDYWVSYLTPFGTTSIAIDGSNALGNNSVLQNCNTTTGGGATDGGDNQNISSIFKDKPDLHLIDGTAIDKRFMEGIDKLYGENPNYGLAIKYFACIVQHPYNLSQNITLPSGERVSEFEQWYDVIDYSYTKALEAAGYMQQRQELDATYFDLLISAINTLKTNFQTTENARDRLFEIELDEALLYRLIGQRESALDKIINLKSNNMNDEDAIRMLNYYQCLIRNEIVIETSEDKSVYVNIDECKGFLGLDEGVFEVQGERPEDPIWRENLGKRGSASDTSDTSVNPSSVSIVKGDIAPSIAVYPNPANDIVFIQLPSAMYVDEINIIDITGKVILKHAQLNLSGTITLPLELKNGIYFVEVNRQNVTVTRKKLSVVTK